MVPLRHPARTSQIRPAHGGGANDRLAPHRRLQTGHRDAEDDLDHRCFSSEGSVIHVFPKPERKILKRSQGSQSLEGLQKRPKNEGHKPLELLTFFEAFGVWTVLGVDELHGHWRLQ